MVSFSISYGPAPREKQLMTDWIRILVAFVNNDETYDYGTKTVQEMKVITPEGTIEVQKDQRWDELVRIGDIFSGGKA
ncbi:hypothetical protein NW757_009862 [Fusarium falciforme]|nr:hypothetical protein NW757_009862 [Fusarium falciforme]